VIRVALSGTIKIASESTSMPSLAFGSTFNALTVNEIPKID
jgi:hypothetical protein